MEMTSLIVSILALVAAVFTYWRHDRKLKTQEKLIKAYEIDRIEAERIAQKKGAVRAELIGNGRGSYTIRISNTGKAKSNNIRVEFEPEEYKQYIRTSNFPFPYLNSEDSTELFMIAYEGMKPFEIKMIWDDESGDNNEYSQILTI